MALAKLFKDIGHTLRPDLLVGCRYRFGTVFGGEEMVVEGIITNFHTKEGTHIRYYVTGHLTKEVPVLEVIKAGREDWFLLVKVTRDATQLLPGAFTII